jgi:hypothetical protein
MTNFIFFLFTGLFTWRVTRLIIDDAIAERPVNFLFKISKSNKYLLKLLTCYYCLGFWISLGAYILITVFTDYFNVSTPIEHIVLIGALASFPPLIQEFIPEEE